MIITVSGKTFYGGMDPLCTDRPKESGWPKDWLEEARDGLQEIIDSSPV